IVMVFIIYILFNGAYDLIFVPGAAPALAPVLPGITIPGLPKLSFWRWIIAIFIVAVIHEFSHGVLARLYKINIKSSGFAFFGPILAAFVEPDENQMKKRKKNHQLAIISAGPFANAILALLILLFFNFIFLPFENNFIEPNGVMIVKIELEGPAFKAGLTENTIIKEINNNVIKNQQDLFNILKDFKQDTLTLVTDKGDYEVKPDFKDNRAYLGVSITNLPGVKENYPSSLLQIFTWFNMLFFWLWVISLGIGLFNLLPFGPIDGGRMFQIAAFSLFEKKKANNLFKTITLIMLVLIIINLSPYLIKLFSSIFSLFS
ncbi:MAG: site-2 protease family protein, partial [Nanoarchaeota archaeon]